MIPTKSKEKLPKGKAYPVGAEGITEILKDVPQIEELVLYFYIQDEYWASKYNKKIKEGGEIRVLETSLSSPFYDWRINICSVPSQYKSEVKRALISEALPRLNEKLKNYDKLNETFSFHATYNIKENIIKINS
jgi:hypothetical protein